MDPFKTERTVLEALTPRGSRILSLTEVVSKVAAALDVAVAAAVAAAAAEGSTRPADPDLVRPAVEEAVARLERKGQVVRTRGEKLSRIEFTDLQAGTLAVRGEGKGFLLSGDRAIPDIPIARGALGSALDGDFVLVRVEKTKAARGSRVPGGADRGNGGGGSRSGPRGHRLPPALGTVLKILVRRRETIVGRIVRGPDGTVLVPFDQKLDALVRIPDGKDLAAPERIWVEARIVSFPDEKRVALAEVTELIGFDGEAGVDVEVVSRKWGLPRTFTEAALAEAEASLGDVSPDERAARADFTARTIVTIDGETARDFDDAIEAEALPGGGFRIGVHIADVSHYVRPGTALDADAWERGTSVYFPDRAIPMLPERLSNDLCSLRPDGPRRTLTAVLTLDREGETVKAEFYRSLIHSRARLTYNKVAALLEGKSPEESEVPAEVVPMLRTAAEAAKVLRGKRERRGSLDFDLPDADLILGESGDVIDIVRAVRNEAHRLIEEFMLAANEAVARHLQFIPTPALYRVHDRPDDRKLADLRSVLEPLGYDIPEDDEEVRPAVFQAILDQAEGRPEERFVSDLVLRSQKKALYTEECRGHYALAAQYYAHFTSPIRRYPDLLVHRALAEWIATRRAPEAEEAEGRTRWMAEAGPHCSSRERRAESAEREALAWKKFVYLSDRVGTEFDAYVSAVVPFGLFVLLADVYVEGLVPISSLEDDFYVYEEVEHRLVGTTNARVFRLGDRIRVRLVKADFDRRQLEFAPAGSSRTPRPDRSTSRAAVAGSTTSTSSTASTASTTGPSYPAPRGPAHGPAGRSGRGSRSGRPGPPRRGGRRS